MDIKKKKKKRKEISFSVTNLLGEKYKKWKAYNKLVA